jgi:tetratricopeptide (TPR) repeat protein
VRFETFQTSFRHAGCLPPSSSTSTRRFAQRCLTFAFLAVASAVRAHPEIEDALSRLNSQLAATPNDAALYLDRGQLYARHEEWIAAEANYLRAAELAPTLPGLARARGALALAQQQPAEARTQLDAALAGDPADAEALILHGKAQSALGNMAAAIADFDRALQHLANPTPAFFLARAALHKNPADALRSLDEGIARLGSVVPLELRALGLEQELGRTHAALARLDRLAEQSERKEIWLKRRGDVLARAGRTSDARAAYAEAVAAILALPGWLQQSPDTARLLGELRQLTSANS